MATRPRNGHTPGGSDANPIAFFNPVNDPDAMNKVNPEGFESSPTPASRLGYTQM
jgi:hypothetical protein